MKNAANCDKMRIAGPAQFRIIDFERNKRHGSITRGMLSFSVELFHGANAV